MTPEAEPRLSESKHDCRLILFSDEDKESQLGEFTGTLHLFTHEYDAAANFNFWYGVADVACPGLKLIHALHNGGKPARVAIRCQLDDGRSGSARHLTTDMSTGGYGNVRLALIGFSPLVAK